jgi:hypothetical protein
VFREEFHRLVDWGERHRRLVARLTFALASTAVVVLIAAAGMDALEAGVKGSEIHGYWDAVFFSTVQTLTVSSQLRNPVTTGGRVIDILLEIWAIVVVTGSAGSFASFFMDADSD